MIDKLDRESKEMAERDLIGEAIERESSLSDNGSSSFSDIEKFLQNGSNPIMGLQTLDELLDRDKKREEDGFSRRIRLGKIVKPSKDKKGKVVIVPTTFEPKFYHDNSVTEEEDGGGTGGSGEGEEGEVIGEQQAKPEEGEGEGTGAGEGDGANHDISNDAFDLGKALTEKFKLPNLKDKGKKTFSNKI